MRVNEAGKESLASFTSRKESTMTDRTATFFDHKVTPEGLYIRGLLDGWKIEILVPREEAEMFGWIDPEEEEEDAAIKEALQGEYMAVLFDLVDMAGIALSLLNEREGYEVTKQNLNQAIRRGMDLLPSS